MMPISSTALPLVHRSLPASTSATELQLTGIPKSKQQWKQPHMVLSLWLSRQQLSRFGPEYTLRYLVISIKSKSYMLGNNSAVVTSGTLPHSTLSKRNNRLAFHSVREAIAAKIIDFHWIQSKYNLSDMLSMHWELIKIFAMIIKFLITCGPITLIQRSATEEAPKLSK